MSGSHSEQSGGLRILRCRRPDPSPASKWISAASQYFFKSGNRWLRLVIWALAIALLTPRLWTQPVYLDEIKNPAAEFKDWRQFWIGRQVRFLPGVLRNSDQPFFEFSTSIERWYESHPGPSELIGRTARFERVFHFAPLPGTIHFIGQFQSRYLWQLRLDDNGEVLYFRDSGAGVPQTFAFVEILNHVKQLTNLEFWAKDERFLYSVANDTIIPLKNLEKVQVVQVEMGEYGNFPTRIFIRKENGQVGYLTTSTVEAFGKRWFMENPRLLYPAWDNDIWQLIQRRTIRSGMEPAMVLLSWGEPVQKDTVQTLGQQMIIWKYQGVNQTTYTLEFLDNRLAFIDY